MDNSMRAIIHIHCLTEDNRDDILNQITDSTLVHFVVGNVSGEYVREMQYSIVGTGSFVFITSVSTVIDSEIVRLMLLDKLPTLFPIINLEEIPAKKIRALTDEDYKAMQIIGLFSYFMESVSEEPTIKKLTGLDLDTTPSDMLRLLRKKVHGETMSGLDLTNTIRLHMTECMEEEEILGSLYNSSILHYLVGPLTEELLDSVMEFTEGTGLVVMYSNTDPGIDNEDISKYIRGKFTEFNVLLNDEDSMWYVQRPLEFKDITGLLDADIVDGILFPKDEVYHAR